ncbi:MAG: sulfur carrier protein ThiS adenylyltransferase ThiF [Saccharofermentans sp.]|nr:sulfur carrier protein ThiS adenylyltransferase ThiF [Saccharofermentans sp.]
MERSEWNAALDERIGKARRTVYENSTVGIAGLGGLGSNIAISLARAGIGKLVIADFDKVDITNLNRQQYLASQIGTYKTDAMEMNLKSIAPFIGIGKHCVKIDEDNITDIFGSCDIVVEALDGAEQKAMLVNTVLSSLPGKVIVSGSGMAGFGDANLIKTQKVMKGLYVCGDMTSDVDTSGSLVSARVMVCAGHQALAVLRLLTGEMD